MPVTADSFLWEATGFFVNAGTGPVVVTHPDAGGTTAGSSVVVVFGMSSAATVTRPAGFASLPGGIGTSFSVKSDVSGGETSWSFTITATTGTWYLVELSDDVAIEDPQDGTGAGANGTVANGGTLSSGTTAMNAGSSGMALAVFHSTKLVGSDVQSWGSYTDSFTERVDVSPAAGSTAGRTLAVAWKPYDGWSTWTTTATFATTGAGVACTSRILLVRSADASINAPLSYCTTFGFGTHAGMGASALGTLASATSPLGVGTSWTAAQFALGAFPVGTWGTNYSVGAYGRDGRTGLEIAAAAATANVNIPGNNAALVGLNVQAVSGSGTPEVLRIDSSVDDLFLLYDVTSEKFGLQWTGGTAVWQTGTTPLGTWAWVDIKTRAAADVWHADWSIETGTGDGSQASPTDLTGKVANTALRLYLGGSGSQTGVFRYSDVVHTTYRAAYPLGPHIVRVLLPETTGATVSGTAGDFSEFTSNGTLAAFTSGAGALLDDVPPTISASSDGVVQDTADAAGYMNFPMTTYTLAADEIIAGVRAFASLWGGTGSGTGTLGLRGWDGTTEATFTTTASITFDPDSLTTASATYPMWHASMWGVGTRWTQALLDAAALRGGFSTDATPDMGFSCMGLEVATRDVVASQVVHRLTDDEDPEAVAATVTERLHPYTSGVRTYTVSNDDATRTAEFNYSISGTPQTPVTVAPAAAPVDVTVNAEAFGEVDSTSFGWQ